MTNTIEDTDQVTWESAKAWLERDDLERQKITISVQHTQRAAMQSTTERLLASFHRQAELRAKMGRR